MSKKRKGRKSLTAKQERFAKEYLTNLNASEAAKAAGYSDKTARSVGSENLTKPDIQTAIQRAMDERAERTNVRADNVILELANIGFSDLYDFIRFNGNKLEAQEFANLPPGATRAMKKIKQKADGTIEFELWDKPKALELLGKHLKLWLERKEITGKDGGPIQVENSGLDLSQLTDEEFDEFRALSGKAFKRLGLGEGSGAPGEE